MIPNATAQESSLTLDPTSILKQSSRGVSQKTLTDTSTQRSKIFFDTSKNTIELCSNRFDLRQRNQWEDSDKETAESLTVINKALSYLAQTLKNRGILPELYEIEEVEIPVDCSIDVMIYMEIELDRIKDKIQQKTRYPIYEINRILEKHKEIKEFKRAQVQIGRSMKLRKANQILQKTKTAEISTASLSSKPSQNNKRKTLEPDPLLVINEIGTKEIKLQAYPIISDEELANISVSGSVKNFV